MKTRTPVQKPLLSKRSRAGALVVELACLSAVV